MKSVVFRGPGGHNDDARNEEVVMRTFLVSCLVLGLAGVSRAQDESPRALIEKALKVLGHADRPEQEVAVYTRFKGSLAGPAAAAGIAAKITGEGRWQSGAHLQQINVEILDQKITLRRAWRDGKGWQQDETGKIKDLDADDLAEMKQSEYITRVTELRPLLKDKAFTLTALGKSTVEGVEALGVKVSSPGHSDVKLYFDRKTGYPKQIESRKKQKGQDKEVVSTVIFDDFREIDPVGKEEGVLKSARIGTDDKALLEFLRGRVRSEEARDKVKGLITQLGDDSFDVREKASAELIRLGEIALPELKKAAKSNDAEIARRAQDCLKKIGEIKDLLPAALRLVALKRPAGAAEVLLALAPSLTDEESARELRGALAAVAVRDGKPDKLVEKALEDKDAARRAAAAAALGKDGGAFAKEPNRRLHLRGVKRAMKETYAENGEKQLILEVTEVQVYNRFDEKIFDKPK
jgi:hypothetical protein